MCFRYGTGCFLLRNTGPKVPLLNICILNTLINGAHIVYCSIFLVSVVLQPVMSDHGLLTTVAYKLGRDKPAFYALEVQDLNFIIANIS